MGLDTLTHTPNPMAFLGELLERPANEKAMLVMPVGLCRIRRNSQRPLAKAVGRNRCMGAAADQGVDGIDAWATGTLNGSHQMSTHAYVAPAGSWKEYVCAPALLRSAETRNGRPVFALFVVFT